jgi:hypothetical protein
MSFDPITFSSIAMNKPPVGSFLRVMTNFSHTNYVDTNQRIDVTQYPMLADQVAGGFQGDYFKSVSFPSLDSQAPASFANLGDMACSYTTGGHTYFIFASTTTLKMYRTIGSTIDTGVEFVQDITNPSALAPNALVFSVANGHVFISGTTQNANVYRYDITVGPSSMTTITLNLSRTWRFVYGSGRLVAYATSIGSVLSTTGNVQVSLDNGATWTNHTALAALSTVTSSMAYGNGFFVVVTQGTGAATNTARSTDGLTWVAGSGAPAGALSSVSFNPTNNLFTIYSMTNVIAAYRSSSAAAPTTWVVCSGNTSNGYLYGDCTPNGVTIAHGKSPYVNSFYTSLDNVTFAAGFLGNGYNAAMYDRGFAMIGETFVMFGSSISGALTAGPSLRVYYKYSNDYGVTWTDGGFVDQYAYTTQNYLYPCIGSDTSKIVMFENQAAMGSDTVWMPRWSGIVSNDGGTTWENMSIETPELVNWGGVFATTDGKFVAWGRRHTNNLVYVATSTDGAIWIVVQNGTFVSPTPTGSMAIGTNGNMMFTQSNSTNTVAISSDYGATWTSKTVPASALYKAAFFGNVAVALNTATGSYYSTNGGTSWSLCAMTVIGASTIAGYAANSTYGLVTLTNSNICFVTSDGISWIQKTLPTTMGGVSPTVVNDWFMIPTGGGTYYRTQDFLSWELAYINADVSNLGAYTVMNSNPNNSSGAIHGPTLGASTGTFWVADTEVTNMRRIPYVAPDLANTKYVVVAR